MATNLKSLTGLRARRVLLVAPVAAALAAGGAWVSTAIAQNAQPAASSADAKRKEKQVIAGEAEAKQLLLLMDRDQSGKVSRQEFMSYMEAEFNRLDINKDGELDVNELIQSKFVPHGGLHR